MEKTWKAIYVKSRTEKKVALRLSEKGIEVYVPLIKSLRQWSDRKKMVELPMLNGYVLVRPSVAEREVVLQTEGVMHYVRYNSGDAIVRDLEVEALKSIEEKGYFVEGEFSKDLSAGDRVKIEHGPFKGLYGSVKTQAKESVYNISIEGIGYALTVKVPEEVLVKRK